MKKKTSPVLLWGKRLLIYILGVYLMAIAAVLSARSSLGVGPVNSLGKVLFQVGRAAGAPAWVNLGNCTTAVFCLYLFAEYLLLLREFKLTMSLQPFRAETNLADHQAGFSESSVFHLHLLIPPINTYHWLF